MTTDNRAAALSFAVLTPSRGLVHSRTIEAVEANISEAVDAGHDFAGWVLTHDLPIPDCHERVTELGLATGADPLWFVEEDMIPPPGALLASLEVLPEAPIATMNYPIGVGHPYGNCLPPDPINWCGLGCTLVSRRVFEAVDPLFCQGMACLTAAFGVDAARDMPAEQRWQVNRLRELLPTA